MDRSVMTYGLILHAFTKNGPELLVSSHIKTPYFYDNYRKKYQKKHWRNQKNLWGGKRQGGPPRTPYTAPTKFHKN